ncbi:MAG: NGG1p interacting factor NIF3 [Methanomassiliicoccales archaeon]|jgi:putative NIF3 family GTP cyclohydrolase 1 type 2|nr:NGG1p interacting factor NIF3 [Methanomassiliicoccales archaeon]
MKLEEIYKLAVQLGSEADPRTQQELEAELKAQKERYEKLDARAKQRFDQDLLWNPYHDSRLLFGEEGAEVRSALIGIDITPGEILIADRLREKGQRVDAVIGHHPLGKARNIFPEVMHVQENMYHEHGVPINVIEDLMAPRIREVLRAVHPANFDQAVDAARLLNVPLMCTHSPCDMLGQRFVQKLLDKKRPTKVSDIIDALMGMPEYDLAARSNNQPEVYVGERGRKAGKVIVKFAGGTAGPKEMYDALSKAGVGTVVCMHIPENHIEEAKKAHMNVLIAGHMASDSIGLNLLADRLEKRGVKVTPFSGYLRVKRG